MATCILCKRNGFFLSVSPRKLCETCDPEFRLQMRRCLALLEQMPHRIKMTTTLGMKLVAFEHIIESVKSLIRYEHVGLPTLNTAPSKLASILAQQKEKMVVEYLTGGFERAKTKAGIMPLGKTRINLFVKVLFDIREHKASLADPSALEVLEKEVSHHHQWMQLDTFLQEGHAFEFKKQPKKALQRYYDALYFLRNDEIPDALQKEHIAWIEARIAALGGRPGS